jgi:hypothetical protein
VYRPSKGVAQGMQTVYAYSGRDIAESRRGLALMCRNEFTEGEVEIEPPGGEVRAFIRRSLVRPILLMRSMNGTGISFRRSWHHIRSTRAAVRLLYFIHQGELRVVNSAGSYSAGPGKCAIINADEPFLTRTFIGDRGSFECTLAVVPEHLVLSHLPWARHCNSSFELEAGHRPVVTGLLDLLCNEGPRLGPKTVEPLVAYDEQYETDLLGTLATFLDCDASVNATAARLITHRHTVRYRFERVRELTGLDVQSTDGREQLSLGLKAMRVLGIAPPRGPASEPGAEGGRVPR